MSVTKMSPIRLSHLMHHHSKREIEAEVLGQFLAVLATGLPKSLVVQCHAKELFWSPALLYTIRQRRGLEVQYFSIHSPSIPSVSTLHEISSRPPKGACSSPQRASDMWQNLPGTQLVRNCNALRGWHYPRLLLANSMNSLMIVLRELHHYSS